MRFWHSSHQFPYRKYQGSCKRGSVTATKPELVSTASSWICLGWRERWQRWFSMDRIWRSFKMIKLIDRERIPNMSENDLLGHRISPSVFFPLFVLLSLSLLLVSPSAPISVSKILWESLICHIYRLTSCPNSRKEIILTMRCASSWTLCSRRSVWENEHFSTF